LIDPIQKQKFNEKNLEKSFRKFLKILKFKHQKAFLLKQERTTAEDQEENERREKEIHDVKATSAIQNNHDAINLGAQQILRQQIEDQEE
jgi:hypothetical protein